MAKDEQTPMMRQFAEAKKACPSALLLFRLGDFYEMFQDDAKLAAQVLGLALTSRGKGVNQVPMAGFPYHQLDSYLAKLIAAGHRAAVCEQVEDPKKVERNALVKRQVTRIITPGTLTDETFLDPRTCNYLAAFIDPEADKSGFKSELSGPLSDAESLAGARLPIGISWVELSTGQFYAATIPRSQLADYLARISPPECLVLEREQSSAILSALPKGIMLTKRPDWAFGVKTAADCLLKHFGVASLEGFGFTEQDTPAIRAAGGILDYLSETQKQSLAHIDSLRKYGVGEQLEMDESTRRSLEISQTIRGGGRESTLFGVLDRCVTPMGSRLLSGWLASPLLNVNTIRSRQDAVAEFASTDSTPRELRECLRRVFDMQRLMTRVVQSRSTPRDLSMITRTLKTLPEFRKMLSGCNSELLSSLREQIDPCEEIADLLERALIENELPSNTSEGGFIKDGFCEELDLLREMQNGGKRWIAEYQAEQITRTGISSLRVGYTRVFGYYIEVTNTHRSKIPQDFLRKQTLVNAERFITPELKEYEEKVLTAGERASELEYSLFCRLQEHVASIRPQIQKSAWALSQLDVLAALATLAREKGFCRPEVVDEPILEIVDGRHPVLDILEPAGTFVPNDTFSGENERIYLITGPNMAGKSTFIRQIALLTIMSQIGSFIPARTAKIGVADRIFARVGASDDLSRGQSTFMVEMTETARILHGATSKSLVILDEIGRGTSTYDGISLAWAIVEYLHDNVGCRTFFATHYHELTCLPETLSGVANLNVSVKEYKDEIAFLHKIVAGAADKSYGIHVARLAGVPRNVIHRAKEILSELEEPHISSTSNKEEKRVTESGVQMSLFGAEDHPIIDELRTLEIDRMSPIEAFQSISRWIEQLKSNEQKKRKRS